jgi:hypothetical protein
VCVCVCVCVWVCMYVCVVSDREREKKYVNRKIISNGNAPFKNVNNCLNLFLLREIWWSKLTGVEKLNNILSVN